MVRVLMYSFCILALIVGFKANRCSLLDTNHLESLSIKLSTCSLMDWWVKEFKTETLGWIMLVAENCDILLNSG